MSSERISWITINTKDIVILIIWKLIKLIYKEERTNVALSYLLLSTGSYRWAIMSFGVHTVWYFRPWCHLCLLQTALPYWLGWKQAFRRQSNTALFSCTDSAKGVSLFSMRRVKKAPYQFLPCNFYKRMNKSQKLSDF